MARRKPVPKVLVVEVGAALRDAREAKGISQEALAEAAGVAQEEISRFENGKQAFGGERLLRLLRGASALGISLDYVVTGKGTPVITPGSKTVSVDALREFLESQSK